MRSSAASRLDVDTDIEDAPTEIIDFNEIARDLRTVDRDVTDDMVSWVIDCQKAEAAAKNGTFTPDRGMLEFDLRCWDTSSEEFEATP